MFIHAPSFSCVCVCDGRRGSYPSARRVWRGPIKALTVRQPWAMLIAHGLTSFGARTWRTSHRGWLAIHAGQTLDRAACEDPDLLPYLIWSGVTSLDRIPLGAVVCVVHLHTIFPRSVIYNKLGARERWLLAGGQYIWWFRKLTRLHAPIPARGRPGLWDWDAPSDLVALLGRDLTTPR